MFDGLSEEFLDKLIEMDEIPNVPYLTTPIEKYIRGRLNEIIHEDARFEIKEDEFSFYCSYRSGLTRYHTIFDTHLDHPGFAVDSFGRLLSVGSIPNDELAVDLTIFDNNQAIAVYDKHGKFVSHESLINPSFERSRKFYAATSGANQPVNSSAILDLGAANVKGDMLSMRSADNYTNTAICIDLINQLHNGNLAGDVTFIFNKLEEVRQISAVGAIIENKIPISSVKPNLFIVLECATVPPEFDHTKLVVRIADGDINYDFGSLNLARSVILTVLQKSAIDFSYGGLHNQSNATPYVLIGGQSNVIGLTIPCYHKHNTSVNGWSHEMVSTKALASQYQLLSNVLVWLSKSDEVFDVKQFDEIVEDRHYRDAQSRSRKIESLLGAYRWAAPRLKRGKLFGESILELYLIKLQSYLTKTPLGM